jgi:subtilisin family serine protease
VHKFWMRVLLSFTLLGMFLPWGCGDDNSPRTAKERAERNIDSLPTEKNIEKWLPLWSKGTWILGTKNWSGSDLEGERLKKAVTFALLSTFEILPETHSFTVLYPRLFNNIDMQLLRDPDGKFAFESKENIGLTLVTLKNQATVFENLLQHSHALASLPIAERETSFAEAQFNALRMVKGVAWAEPNLYSKLLDSRLQDANQPPVKTPYIAPEEFRSNQGAPIVETLQRIKADLAFKHVGDLGLPPGQVHVAILDTGVDFEHPELKPQMFVNPREIAGNRLDDDGNGYIDDIHGINATLEKDQLDPGPAPTPGPADVGGPGATCPQSSKEDSMSGNCGHGTHVAGIVAARAGGDLNTIGICPHCKIISIRVAERCIRDRSALDLDGCIRAIDKVPPNGYEVDGGITDAAQINALEYLTNLRRPENSSQLYVNVINMSLGKYLRSRSMRYAIDNLRNHNVVVVAAAGNDNTDTPSYPAAYSTVVAVCATGTKTHRGPFGKAWFSNFGEWVDICAPGTDIYSTMPGKDESGGGNTFHKSGTSQAGPFVAGAVGFLLAYSNNAKTADRILQQLYIGSDDDSLYDAPLNKGFYSGNYKSDSPTQGAFYMLGSGILDLEAAIKETKSSVVPYNQQGAVKNGCIAQSIGSKSRMPLWETLFSVPFILAQIYVIFLFLRAMIRRLST